MKSDSPDGTVSWGVVLGEAIQRFYQSGFSEMEARWLVEEVAGCELVGASLDELVTNRKMALYDNLLARRLSGEPLQYVLGHWQFRNLDLMIDQRVREGEKVKFFNNLATTTTIPAQLVKKYNCELIPIYIERKKANYFKIYISKPIKVSKSKSILEITEFLNKILEKMILKNVDQWIWTHDRWKI